MKRRDWQSTTSNSIARRLAIIACSGLLVAFGSLSASASQVHQRSHATPLTPVTIVQAGVYSAGAPYYVAQKLGYFQREHLSVNIVTVQGSSALMASVASGSAQFGQPLAVSMVPAAIQNGLKLLAVSSFTIGFYGNTFVVAKSVAKARHITKGESWQKTLRAMHGTTIGVLALESTTGQLVKGLLKKLGLPPTWLTEVGIAGSAVPTALVKGSIQGFIEGQPAPDIAIKQYGAVPTWQSQDPPGFKNMEGVVLVTTPAYAKSHQRVVREMITACIMGTDALLKGNKKAWNAVYGYLQGASPSIIHSTILAQGMVANGAMSAANWRATVGAGEELSLYSHPPTASQVNALWTSKYIPKKIPRV